MWNKIRALILGCPKAIRKGQRLKIAGVWFQIDDIFPTGLLLRLVNKRMSMEVCDAAK